MNSNESLVQDALGIFQTPAAQQFLDTAVKRIDILPLLFRIKGKPYSLDDRLPFEAMFSAEYAPDTIWMTARQIGKSIGLSRSEVLDCLSIPYFQVLYVAPLQKQTQRYSLLCLREAINSCTVDLNSADIAEESDSTIVTSVHHQTFGNGSGIQLTYAKTSPDRARGITSDRIDFDEIQDQLTDNIPIISESLTDSQWGIRRFTGTAKTTDNTIENLWQSSSMCEWVMRCGCGFYNIPNIDGHILDMLQPQGVVCIKCGRILNVRNGEFIAAHPERMKTFRGFHIPQIIIPAITENPQKWGRLINKILRLPVATTMQEILGISCSEGTRLITDGDIKRQSIPETSADLQKLTHEYAFTVGGVDWGVAEQTSFTVHTIIGLRPTGEIQVLYARRFMGFDPDETLHAIAQAHQFYGCRLIACDYGMGFDKNVMLETRFGLPVVQIMYCRQIQLLTLNPALGHTRYMVDKTTALELLFMAIKYGKIWFPNYAEFKTYTDDLLAIYETVADGDLERRYFDRNPNHPDDFAHALCFAVMTAMRSMNASIVDMIPNKAFNADKVTTAAPPIKHMDTKEIIASGR